MSNPNSEPIFKAMEPRYLPLSERTPEERIAVARKGGLSTSPKKSIASKLVWMKKRGLTDENAKILSDVLSDPELSALDIRDYLQRIKESVDASGRDGAKIQLSKVLVDWHKATHGEKLKTENMNFNVSIKIEDWEKRLME